MAENILGRTTLLFFVLAMIQFVIGWTASLNLITDILILAGLVGSLSLTESQLSPVRTQGHLSLLRIEIAPALSRQTSPAAELYNEIRGGTCISSAPAF